MDKASKRFHPSVLYIVVIAIAGAIMNCDLTTGTEEPVTGLTDNSLKSLALSGNGSWDREFSPQVLDYTYTVKNTVESVTFTPAASSDMSQIIINGTECKSNTASRPIPLNVGNNQTVIKVSAQTGAAQQYNVVVVRLASDVRNDNDAALASLSIAGATLQPSFNSETITYTATVPESNVPLNVGASARSAGTTISYTLDGVAAANPQAINFTGAAATLAIVVTAADGTTKKTYTVAVTKSTGPPPPDAALASLSIAGATLQPSFNPETITYTAIVPESNVPLNVGAAARTAGSAISYTLDGVAAANPQAINFTGAAATLAVVVTATDGTTKKTYTVAVTKSTGPPPPDATLASLSIAGATLQPAFNPETISYTASVPESKVPLNVSAAARTGGSAISYTLDGVAAAKPRAINFTAATATLAVVVTATDGTTKKTYTVAVTKSAGPPPPDAALASLSIAGATLQPAFNPETISYTASVPESNVPLNVSAAARTAGSAISYTLDGVAAANPQAIALTGATATLAVVVTATDGTTKKTYTVAVTKVSGPSSSSASLKGIELTFGKNSSRRPLYHSFNEPTKTTFDSAIENYAAVVYACSSITIKATATDPAVTSIVISGSADGTHASGVKTASVPIFSSIGKVTPVVITVTGKDGSTVKKYSVAVKLLNADEFFWGIYALHYIKSYHRWRDTVPNPGPGLNKTIKGYVSGALDWNITMSGLRGKNHMKMTDYSDGNDDQGSTPIYTPYNDNTGENKEDGFVVNSDLMGDLSLFGNGTQTGTIKLSTPWGDKIASIGVHYIVKSKQIAIDPDSYTTITYMGQKRRFKYVGGAENYPYPFEAGYDWNTPWTAGK